MKILKWLLTIKTMIHKRNMNKSQSQKNKYKKRKKRWNRKNKMNKRSRKNRNYKTNTMKRITTSKSLSKKIIKHSSKCKRSSSHKSMWNSYQNLTIIKRILQWNKMKNTLQNNKSLTSKRNNKNNKKNKRNNKKNKRNNMKSMRMSNSQKTQMSCLLWKKKPIICSKVWKRSSKIYIIVTERRTTAPSNSLLKEKRKWKMKKA